MDDPDNDMTYRELLILAMRIVGAQREVLDLVTGPNLHVTAEIATIERRQAQLDHMRAL